MKNYDIEHAVWLCVVYVMLLATYGMFAYALVIGVLRVLQ